MHNPCKVGTHVKRYQNFCAKFVPELTGHFGRVKIEFLVLLILFFPLYSTNQQKNPEKSVKNIHNNILFKDLLKDI